MSQFNPEDIWGEALRREMIDELKVYILKWREETMDADDAMFHIECMVEESGL